MLLPSAPPMVSVVVCLVLGLLLVGAAGLKAAGGSSSRAALATYGIADPRAAFAVWGSVIAVAVVLGIAATTGIPEPAAIFLSGAAVVQLAALLSGRKGAPCACFGTRGK